MANGGSIENIYGAIPELRPQGDANAILVFRRFMNDRAQRDIIWWLTGPLTPDQLNVISKRLRRWFLDQPEALRLGIDRGWLMGFVEKIRSR